jgi:SAM-dependent methyltransferase
MRIEQEIVESILATLTPRRALDVGTGSGRYLPILARTGARIVAGVDFSRAMLRRVSSAPVVPDLSPAVVCANALQLPFERRSFDLINASLMVGDVGDLNGWTCEMARTLARGGHLIYSDFHPSWASFGWRRTFRGADGVTYDVGYAPHTIDEHLSALHAAGLRVTAIREPRFKDDVDADVRAFRRRWKNPPVVVVFHAIKVAQDPTKAAQDFSPAGVAGLKPCATKDPL